ncbi:MAG: 5-formyltetrahydrofolate cyclo-ligase [Candidatus Protistobacter heckmanni]|nr:5-formyltetrahydrofolate cyclo-ligase [Candidatus Protistobacter heckmanni]
MRRSLLAQRQALESDPGHARCVADLQRDLLALLERLRPRCVALYWPMRGEFDPRPAIQDWLEADAARAAALPDVTGPALPMRFLAWATGSAMVSRAYDIPVPKDGKPIVPDLILLPCLGFSLEKGVRYRLGYGGGYYDRTLAAFGQARPVCVGLAFEVGRLESLGPQAHDAPMDHVVTERGTF